MLSTKRKNVILIPYIVNQIFIAITPIFLDDNISHEKEIRKIIQNKSSMNGIT